MRSKGAKLLRRHAPAAAVLGIGAIVSCGSFAFVRTLHLTGLAWAILLSGLAVTGLVAHLLNLSRRTGLRALELAERMTERTKRDESRLRAITRVMPDLVMVLDEDDRYIELYTGDESCLVAPRAALLMHTLQECLPEESARFISATLHRALESSEVLAVEYPLETQRGSRWLEARVAALDQEIDGKRCVIWVSRDITERKREEENLRQSQKLESLGVLAGGIAHDFNNLLTAMLANLNLAQLRAHDPAATTSYLKKVESAVHKASDLARQMLAYSGRACFSIQPLGLNRTVEEMTDLLSVSISKKVTLRFKLLPDLPMILADAAQVQQVVMNLVTNASEAIGDRDGNIVITTGSVDLDAPSIALSFASQGLEPGSYVTLEVSDSGCGMSAELVGRIFDPFFTTKAAGRGLGLSTMLGILRGHRAGIRIHSAPGQGSTFRIYFPAQSQTAPKPDESSPDITDFSPLQGTILVVDDEPAIRSAVFDMLRYLGLEVVLARDGIEAMSIFKERAREIDAVLLDLTMPRMDGNETFQALREIDHDVPVIFSSGFTVSEVAQPRVGRPSIGFIQKPYRIEDLKRALSAALSGVTEDLR